MHLIAVMVSKAIWFSAHSNINAKICLTHLEFISKDNYKESLELLSSVGRRPSQNMVFPLVNAVYSHENDQIFYNMIDNTLIGSHKTYIMDYKILRLH